MSNVPPARLFDEMQKLLLSGHAVETLKSLRAHGLSHGLLPLLDMILEQPLGQRFIDAALTGTDARVRDGKPVSPAFLFPTLLWHEVLSTWTAAKERGERPLPALFEAMDKVLEAQAARIAIPRRFEATIKEIWALQPRFEQRSGLRPFRLLEQPRFRAAYDFLVLRGESGEAAADLVDWWTRFQDASAEEREAMLRPDEGPKKRRRSRSRGRKKQADAEAPPPADGGEECARPARRWRTSASAATSRIRGGRSRTPCAACSACRRPAWRRCRPTTAPRRSARRRRSRITSTPSPACARGSRRACCSRSCSASSTARAASGARTRPATPHGRSTSICYYTAAAACARRR
jgi:hypothetical protein